MFSLPPTPSFDGLHPLVIHFPIVAFILAPLFLLLAMVMWKQRLAMMSAAIAMLLVGTLGVFVAVASGKAAGELADRSVAINTVLERHAELAETTRAVFSVLTAALVSAYIAAWLLADRIKRPVWVSTLGVYLVIYASCLLILVNTAHQGGRLVHELGVRAMVAK